MAVPDQLEVLTRVNDSPADEAVIMIHGYGANCQDLAGLQPYLDPDLSRDWFFPNGIYAVEEMMGMGRCWFQLSVGQWLERTGGGGDFNDIYDSQPEDFGPALGAMQQLADSLAKTYSRITVGGFSQGAMLTVQLLPFLHPEQFDRAVLFSGALINRPAWSTAFTEAVTKAKSEAGGSQKLFQSHGRSDMVLPYRMGTDLAEQLKPYCPEHTFVPFDGGHEIPPLVLKEAKTFLGL